MYLLLETSHNLIVYVKKRKKVPTIIMWNIKIQVTCPKLKFTFALGSLCANWSQVRFSCDSFGFQHTPARADQPIWQLASRTLNAQLPWPLPELSPLTAPSCSQINVSHMWHKATKAFKSLKMQLVEAICHLNPLKAAAIFAVFKIPHQYIFSQLMKPKNFIFPVRKKKKRRKTA